jgi:hypothetical protein
MPQNLGRSAIRNALVHAARFEQLLFMDCDSKVVSSDFIKNYLAHAAPDRLVYGGRCYRATPPDDAALRFHWHYGRQREQTTAAERSRSPYRSFMTNNFLIPKAIFLEILFDETLRQYGHEDTLFGMELASRNIPILHIDNPLEHDGLETVAVFLKKTAQGIENLAELQAQGKSIQTKLIDTYGKLEKWRLAGIAFWFLQRFAPMLLRCIQSSPSKLLCFDLYKLYLLMKKQNERQGDKR